MLVKNVTIKGVQWPLVLGMHLTEMVQRHAGKEDFTGAKLNGILLYYGHDNYCMVEGIENKLTLKECYQHLEHVGAEGTPEENKEIIDIIVAFMSSKQVSDLREAAAEVQKKIALGTKSDPTPSE